jgi:hypothetical protein
MITATALIFNISDAHTDTEKETTSTSVAKCFKFAPGKGEVTGEVTGSES